MLHARTPGARPGGARLGSGRSRRLGSLRDDRGAITAEFAIVLPAVLLVLVLAIGAIMLAAHRVTLVAAAAEIARLEARGDAAAGARLAELGPGVAVTRTSEGSLHCVSLSARPAAGLLGAIALSARGCAAAVTGAAGG